jgi:hypothetical protein
MALTSSIKVLYDTVQVLGERDSPEDRPVVCLASIVFDHKKGVDLEYCYPEKCLTPQEEAELSNMAMPDSSHNHSEDSNYFNMVVGDRLAFGVSYYVQQREQSERGYRQCSLAILCRVPAFTFLLWQVKAASSLLKEGAAPAVLPELYSNLSTKLVEKCSFMDSSELLLGVEACPILRDFGPRKVIRILEAVISGRRVAACSGRASSVANFILGLLSLL